jgi:hypothetical protein
MRVHNETGYQVGHALAMYTPERPFMTVVVKGTFRLVEGGPCVALPAAKQPKIGKMQNFMDRHGNSMKQPSDSVPFKARAECLFVGAACAPGGQPVERLDVTFAVGPMRKSLSVFGDRRWVREADGGARLTRPEPFVTLPVRAEYAHGGLASAYNRHGIGFEPLDDTAGASVAVANVQPVGGTALGWDHDGLSAGFGPLPPMALPRRRQLGTMDGRWQVRRRPLPPDDFEVAFFNAAREDQQIDGFLAGDEEILLENLHPTVPQFRARLPGTTVRCFVYQRVDDAEDALCEFAEVQTKLDTCIVNVPEASVTLNWRGTLEIESRRHERIDHLLVVEERIGEEKPAQVYADRLHARMYSGRAEAEAAEKEAQAAQVAALHKEGLAAAVRALEQARAPSELIEAMKRQETLQDAQKLIAEQVDALQALLPKSGG